MRRENFPSRGHAAARTWVAAWQPRTALLALEFPGKSCSFMLINGRCWKYFADQSHFVSLFPSALRWSTPFPLSPTEIALSSTSELPYPFHSLSLTDFFGRLFPPFHIMLQADGLGLVWASSIKYLSLSFSWPFTIGIWEGHSSHKFTFGSLWSSKRRC